MEKFNSKKSIYPLFALLMGLITLVFGLVEAANENLIYFCFALYFFYFFIGFYKAALVSFFLILMSVLVFAGMTFLVTKDYSKTIISINRGFIIVLAVIPGLATPNYLFIKNLEKLKVPRSFTLAMMITLNFFPLFILEMRHIRDAMKTRGAGSIFNPQVAYRAILIPLILRIVNISETLAMSVETRGFLVHSRDYTVYRYVSLRFIDVFYFLIFIGGIILTVVL